MTNTQKGIKTFAIVLGIIIIVSIISLILSGIGLFLNFDTEKDKGTVLEDISLKNVSKVEIELESTNIEILKGSDFKIEKYDTNDNLYIDIKGNTLNIKERSKFFWNSSLGGTVVLYVPNDTKLSEISIDMGAGKATIDSIDAYYIDIDQGAGVVEIKDSIFDETEIDGGAGKIDIERSVLQNLDLSAGVGEVKIDGQILGLSDIDAGVGSIKLNLDGTLDDYTIKAEKGIGSIKIDGQDADRINGNGKNSIKVEGGVGSIDIDFK